MTGISAVRESAFKVRKTSSPCVIGSAQSSRTNAGALRREENSMLRNRHQLHDHRRHSTGGVLQAWSLRKARYASGRKSFFVWFSEHLFDYSEQLGFVEKDDARKSASFRGASRWEALACSGIRTLLWNSAQYHPNPPSIRTVGEIAGHITDGVVCANCEPCSQNSQMIAHQPPESNRRWSAHMLKINEHGDEIGTAVRESRIVLGLIYVAAGGILVYCAVAARNSLGSLLAFLGALIVVEGLAIVMPAIRDGGPA